MGKWVHRMESIDAESMTGVCAHCGPVALHRRRYPNGKTRYTCRLAEQDWKRNYKDPHASKVRRALGVTDLEVAELAEAQGGQCPICAVEFAGLKSHKIHLDHDHSTGRVRGVLCARCNRLLGYIADSPEIARRAAAYLEK